MLNRRNLKLALALTLLALTLYGFSKLTEAAQNGFGMRNEALTEAIEANQ